MCIYIYIFIYIKNIFILIFFNIYMNFFNLIDFDLYIWI